MRHLKPQFIRNSTRQIDVGDILVVYDSTFPAWLIRLGEWLMFRPHKWNHVVIVHHQDDTGVWWGIEARPGRVGWTNGVDMLRYMTSPKTIDNALQLKTPEQRQRIAEMTEKLLNGPSYDWAAIIDNALIALRVKVLWKTPDLDTGQIPTHVICSTFAAWIYGNCGMPYPIGRRLRDINPGDWAKFIIDNGYDSVTGKDASPE